ncbi:30S ribosomal protein S16 [Candidatus Mycoplasma haematominutum]|uniref:Small ribosomal subunit protein bS16 n=1 Tax=Candidatus Mycoplasma haematominutum 'Birmingham 1' TaxID=1116213 RepID=G8C345_9MOLU|nr:30S ribosomal protein S16 [Candidatus Mycoplasma haematominutum]CCE66743.1 ribosomal protein S16 [Candidatus Mycoplasma haematominutum 'Birmingham 1']
MVRIRMKKMGKSHNPVYRIIAIDSKRGRDSAELANLGLYEPKKDYFRLNMTLYQEWISRGAQPTKNLLVLLKAQPKLSHF